MARFNALRVADSDSSSNEADATPRQSPEVLLSNPPPPASASASAFSDRYPSQHSQSAPESVQAVLPPVVVAADPVPSQRSHASVATKDAGTSATPRTPSEASTTPQCTPHNAPSPVQAASVGERVSETRSGTISAPQTAQTPAAVSSAATPMAISVEPPTVAPAEAPVEAALPTRKKKASGGCLHRTSGAKEQKVEDDGARSKKASVGCGVFGGKKKKARDTPAAAATAVSAEPSARTEAATTSRASASHPAGSDASLSIPVAGRSDNESHKSTVLRSHASAETPRDAAAAAAVAVAPITPQTEQTSVLYSEMEVASSAAGHQSEERERDDEEEERVHEAMPESHPTSISGQPKKRVKAVVRRRRELPGTVTHPHDDEPHHTSSHRSHHRGRSHGLPGSAVGEESGALSLAENAASSHQEPAPASVLSPTNSGSQSYSYSYSYSGSDSASSVPSEATGVSAENALVPLNAPQQRAAASAYSSVKPAIVASPLHQNREEARINSIGKAEPSTAGSKWRVRADDLILRDDDPPPSMPAYQRRILLDLHERERRDAEEAARDLRELTFRPRIRAVPNRDDSRHNIIEEDRSHSPTAGTGPVRSPRRYAIRQMSPHLLEPRKTLEPPPPPSFRPEISEHAHRESSPGRSVFQRLYRASRSTSPAAADTSAHTPVISDFARRLYPEPRGARLPQRPSCDGRRESVFDRLYRGRGSPGASTSVSPRRSSVTPPSFHPQITEMAQKQSGEMSREPVGDRLYRQARSPRREAQAASGALCQQGPAPTVGTPRAENVSREYAVGEPEPHSRGMSWSSSSLSSESFALHGPARGLRLHSDRPVAQQAAVNAS